MSAVPTDIPRAAVDAKLLALMRAGAIGLGVLLSGFVIREPAPYELFMVGLIAVWALLGLRVSGTVGALLLLLLVFNFGGVLSILQMDPLYNAPMYIAVSFFLALTAVFFAAVLEARPELWRVMTAAWIASALVTASFGILGYFHAFPGAEMFTKYERAAGVFQDPNVFGPFLVFPAIYLLHQLLTRGTRRLPLYLAPLIVLSFGIFLSFSRGAWGMFAFAVIVLVLGVFARERSDARRLRILLMAGGAASFLVLGLLVALQFPAIADLFTTRAQLVQEYDGSRLGRFARHAIGFMMATEHPFGIGPLNFGRMFGEDTHNIWLKALMDYGWLGFAAWFSMVVWTIAAGFRILFRERPWQPYLLCAWIAFVGHVLLGTVIDTDHWRHFYILIGMIWGGLALEARHQRAMLQRSSRSQL